jgi:hypothetical protein
MSVGSYELFCGLYRNVVSVLRWLLCLSGTLAVVVGVVVLWNFRAGIECLGGMMSDNNHVTYFAIPSVSIAIGVWWYVWGAYGFWWGVLYGLFWPIWLGFRIAAYLIGVQN